MTNTENVYYMPDDYTLGVGHPEYWIQKRKGKSDIAMPYKYIYHSYMHYDYWVGWSEWIR